MQMERRQDSIYYSLLMKGTRKEWLKYLKILIDTQLLSELYLSNYVRYSSNVAENFAILSIWVFYVQIYYYYFNIQQNYFQICI